MSEVVVRRADRPGDLGWMVLAHGEQYAAELGWDATFEALVARIVGDFGGTHDEDREAAWVAEVGGRRVGCVLCVMGDEPGTAQLRILLVTPGGRGRGVGSRLVAECVAFARAAAYDRMTLWTNDVLVSARRIYEAIGFGLVAEQPHHSFGHELIGQTWTLKLR